MDILQLADVFESFIQSATKSYGINPLYIYSSPGYTWKVDLKQTKIKLDYTKEKELLPLLEKNIRGGISSVMGPRYVESNKNKQILHIDASNLYGWAMCQPLPTGEFERITFPEDYTQEQIIEALLQIPDGNESGFFKECDLEP